MAGLRRMLAARTAKTRLRLAVSLLVLAAGFAEPFGAGQPSVHAQVSPIQHIVIIYQENHAFDNVLGKLCVLDHRCDGATSGETADGQTIALPAADDYVPKMAHGVLSQQTVINGGQMNGFSLLNGCKATKAYACYQAFAPPAIGEQPPCTTTNSSICNLATLGRQFVISDRTFEQSTIPTWGAHMELVAGQLDGFTGDNPDQTGEETLHWACDSDRTALWRPAPGDAMMYEPSCIPDQQGKINPEHPGYTSPVPYIPTVMDRLGAAGKSWKIYGPTFDQGGYGFAICPTFWECYNPNSPQRANQIVDAYHGDLECTGNPADQQCDRFLVDARSGSLPAVTYYMPLIGESQHNKTSMLRGDNLIADLVSAVMEGPDWSSTAIFITYDDCGCFYDHVDPPTGYGLRVPMVIVSPYAKAGYTDHTVASFASMLAFIEHTFGLQPLWTSDRDAYDYSNSFDFTQTPIAPITLAPQRLSAKEKRFLTAHPPDRTDPQ